MKARGNFSAHRGFTLVELLVTLAISLILMYGIYEIFISQQRSYTTQGQTATMQKDARMAEEFITKAIMQAGATAPSSTDDPYMRGKGILAAGDHFIMIQSDDPYSTDDGWITGDEVVAFAVSNSPDPAGPPWVQDADASGQVAVTYSTNSGTLATPPDPSEVIFNIGLDLDEPPYTLYRINPDPTDSDTLIWEPVAENVDNLIFRYYDANGNPIPGGALDDADYTLDAEDRARIRTVEMELVLRAERKDDNYDEEFDIQLGSVGSYVAGARDDTKTKFTGDDAKYRRRTFKTRIAPRNLDVISCGTIVFDATGAICPASAPVTAQILDGFGVPVVNDPLNPTIVSFAISPAVAGATVTPATDTPDGSGNVSTQVHYTGTTTTITLVAQAPVACTDGSERTVTNTLNIPFDPGVASWIDITDNGYTSGFELGLCGDTEGRQFTVEALDVCNNVVVPGVPNATFTVYDDIDPTPGAEGVARAQLGFIDGGTSADFATSGQQFTIEPPVDGSGTQIHPPHNGCLQMGVGITNTAALAWLTDGVHLGANRTLGSGVELLPFNLGLIVTPNDQDIFSNTIGDAGIEACPGPPEFITYVDALINGVVWDDCIPTPKTATNTFYLQCQSDDGPGIYKLWDFGDTSVNSIAVDLTTLESRFDPAIEYFPNIIGSLSSDQSGGTGASITIDGATTDTDGLFDITYTGPDNCALDPSTYATSPLETIITLAPTFESNPDIYDADLTSCRDCAFTMTPEIVTPCDGEALITFSLCTLAGPTPIVMEIDLASVSDGGGQPPYWINAAGNPIGRAGAPHILDISTGTNSADGSSLPDTDAAAMIAVGDTIAGTSIPIKVYSLATDTGGEPQWTCPSAGELPVNNVCSNFRAYFENKDGTQTDLDNNSSTCSTEVTELFIEMQHCKYDVDANLPHEITLEMRDELGTLFDAETIKLLPTSETVTIGNTAPPPWEIFRGSIDVKGLPFTTIGGVVPNVLEYPRDSVMVLEIGQWVSAINPADVCPPTSTFVTLNPPVPLCFPNAITSGGGASWNGNFKVHWGDIVVRGIMTEPSAPKLIEKKTDGQFNGAAFGGAGNSDRFLDVYVGHAIPINPPLEDGNVEGNLFPLSAGMQQPFKGTGFGNYYTNISNERISDMIVELNYDLMRDLVSAKNYWVATPGGQVYNPKNRTGPIELQTLLNDPPNDFYGGDFVFIDTFGVAGIDPLFTRPTTNDAQINQDAIDGTLPNFKVAGEFYTEGIIYIAGNLEFGGLGGGTPVTALTPPEFDLRYDHNDLAVTFTDSDIPIKPDPTQDKGSFNVDVHINGAVYVDGEYSGSGNPSVYGALTGERGYNAAGGPEIWYNFALNESGVSNSLCVECCEISSSPSVLDMLPGQVIDITLFGATGGALDIVWESSDTGIVSIAGNGSTAVATAGGAGTKGTTIVWVVDANNCTLAIPVRVDTECVGLTIDPAIVPDAANGGTFTIDTGVSPTEFLTITNLADPADTYIFASWDWVSDDPSVVTVEPSHSGSYTALITGKTCGTAVITAEDNTEACTSTYTTVVTVDSALDFGTFTPFHGNANSPSHFFAGETTTVTTVGASGPLTWSASPTASVSITPLDADGHTVAIEFLEPNNTGLTIQITDQFGCFVTRTFLVQCAAPTINNDPPINGGLYGTATVNGASIEWRANVSDQVLPDTLDQIDRVEFNITPDPGGLSVVYPFTDSTFEYCGFGVSDNCATVPADVSAWPEDIYTLTSTVYANCGTAQVSSTATSTITVDNCPLDYADDFTVADPIWNLDCIQNGCDLAGSSAAIGGGEVVLSIYNDLPKRGPGLLWLDPAVGNYSYADNFVSTVRINSISNPAPSLPDVNVGLTLTDNTTDRNANMIRITSRQVTPGDDSLHDVIAQGIFAGIPAELLLAASVPPPYYVGMEKTGDIVTLIYNPPSGPMAWANMATQYTGPIYLGLVAGPEYATTPGAATTTSASFSDFNLDCLIP